MDRSKHSISSAKLFREVAQHRLLDAEKDDDGRDDGDGNRKEASENGGDVKPWEASCDDPVECHFDVRVHEIERVTSVSDEDDHAGAQIIAADGKQATTADE